MTRLIYLRLGRTICLCLVLGMLVACSSLTPRGRHAAATAASDPWTWAPLTGAAVIVATNNDERISQWAQAKTPVFGSREAASAASDRFRSYSSTTAWALFLVAPPQGTGNSYVEKGMGASGSLAGLALARSTTGMLKLAVKRERPNNSPVHDSFPSAHASDAFAHAALARNYSSDLALYSPWRDGAQWVNNGFAFATAWGRVEGGFHYPSDVLIGAALANFTTRYLMELVPPDAKIDWRLHTRTDVDGAVIIQIELPL